MISVLFLTCFILCCVLSGCQERYNDYVVFWYFEILDMEIMLNLSLIIDIKMIRHVK